MNVPNIRMHRLRELSLVTLGFCFAAFTSVAYAACPAGSDVPSPECVQANPDSSAVVLKSSCPGPIALKVIFENTDLSAPAIENEVPVWLDGGSELASGPRIASVPMTATQTLRNVTCCPSDGDCEQNTDQYCKDAWAQSPANVLKKCPYSNVRGEVNAYHLLGFEMCSVQAECIASNDPDEPLQNNEIVAKVSTVRNLDACEDGRLESTPCDESGTGE